jgi:hypothetical protein
MLSPPAANNLKSAINPANGFAPSTQLASAQKLTSVIRVGVAARDRPGTREKVAIASSPKIRDSWHPPGSADTGLQKRGSDVDQKIYAIWHKASNLWMICGDHASYINHSEDPNTFSMGGVFADDITARDLAAGIGLITDYRRICDYTLETGKLSVS